MIIDLDQPFNRHESLAKLQKEIAEYEIAYKMAFSLYEEIKDLLQSTDEFTIDDVSLSYRSLNVQIKLTEKGIFESVSFLLENLEKIFKKPPVITDNRWAKGKTITFSPIDWEKTASLYITLYGNSKCKLVVTGTETQIVNRYRVECDELQEIKGITHVSSLNAISSDNG